MATDERFDELIGTWLQETAPAQIPARVLEEAAQRTRATRQEVRWRGLLGSNRVSSSILAFGGMVAIVVAAVLALSPRVGQPDVGVLPTTPDAWSRVSIDSRWATAGVDGLVAGPRGLLAFLGEAGSHDMQLSVSTDGRTWRLVPNDQFPSPAVLLPPQIGGRMPAVGTADGFLFVAEGNDVWASEDGYTWHRSADRAQDPDLRAGAIHAVVAGGPGLIAVGGDNKAWYSEDGSDWTLAEVPMSPTESFAAQGYPAPTVDMQGIVVAGDALVAWGNAAATNAADNTMVAPVLWTSDDGLSWASVSDVAGIGWLQDVAAGPDGFVAIGGADLTDAGGIWFSEDSRVWQPAEAEGFRDAQRSSPEVIRSSIAGASSGYVAAAGERGCGVEPCPGARAVIWSSPDGRSWSRLPSDDRFEVADPQSTANHTGAWATSVVAWDSHFVVAGAYDASPVVWISGTPSAPPTPVVSPKSIPDPRGPFLGVWISTSDGDGGTQTMTVELSADDFVEIVVTDTVAMVCSGTSSTMTGSGSVLGDTLVIPAPDYRCDDGTEATTPGGPPPNEQLRNLTYTRDAATDTLSVGIGDVWRREGAEAPSPAPQPSEQVAPPSGPVAPTATAQPSADPGSFEPIVGQIVCGRNFRPGGSPSPTPTPSPSQLTQGDVEPGRYFHEIDGYRYTFTVPESGWAFDVNAGLLSQGDDDAELAIFWPGGDMHELYRRACDSAGTEFDPGPSVDELANAMESLEDFEATTPADVTVSGYEGKRVALTVPMDADVDPAADPHSPSCDGGGYSLSSTRWFQAPGQTDDMWILDVEGERQLIVASDAPGTPADVTAQLEAMVASMEIEPR